MKVLALNDSSCSPGNTVKVAEEGVDALDTKMRELAVTVSGSDLCYPFTDTRVHRAVSRSLLVPHKVAAAAKSPSRENRLCATP